MAYKNPFRSAKELFGEDVNNYNIKLPSIINDKEISSFEKELEEINKRIINYRIKKELLKRILDCNNNLVKIFGKEELNKSIKEPLYELADNVLTYYYNNYNKLKEKHQTLKGAIELCILYMDLDDIVSYENLYFGLKSIIKTCPLIHELVNAKNL